MKAGEYHLHIKQQFWLKDMVNLKQLELFKEAQDEKNLKSLFKSSPSFRRYQFSARTLNQSIYNNKYILYRHYERTNVLLESTKCGEFILDVGCGFGDLSLEIAAKKRVVFLVDRDREVLSIAKRRFSKLGIDGRFILADAHALPFADKVFDISFSNQVIEHIKVPKKFLDEKFRVSKRSVIEICGNSSLLLPIKAIYYKFLMRSPEEIVPITKKSEKAFYINLAIPPINHSIIISVAEFLKSVNWLSKLLSGNVVKLFSVPKKQNCSK